MEWITILAIIVVAVVFFCLFCMTGVSALTKLPSQDEAPALPTSAPLQIEKPVFIPEPTGPPYYLYSMAKPTRDS